MNTIVKYLGLILLVLAVIYGFKKMFGIKEGLDLSDYVGYTPYRYIPQFAMPSVFSGDSVESGECKIECPAGFTGRDDAVGYNGKCVCVNDNTYQYN